MNSVPRSNWSKSCGVGGARWNPQLWSEALGSDQKISLQADTSGRNELLLKGVWLSLRARVRARPFRVELRVETLLLHIKKTLLRWFGHLTRKHPGREVFCRLFPTGQAQDALDRLFLSLLGSTSLTPQMKWRRWRMRGEILVYLIRLLSLQPILTYAAENGWMDLGQYFCFLSCQANKQKLSTKHVGDIVGWHILGFNMYNYSCYEQVVY